uniref:Uncharacterized protein n=1 Tax=Arundo donax TaxID=35708 RepID=A0A0A9C2F6_ARUDO
MQINGLDNTTGETVTIIFVKKHSTHIK